MSQFSWLGVDICEYRKKHKYIHVIRYLNVGSLGHILINFQFLALLLLRI